MSDQNVAVVRTMWEALLANDFEASLAAFDPDHVHPRAGTHSGTRSAE